MKTSRKILFVATNDWTSWGGSEVLWYRAALLLKERGLDVGVSIKKWNPDPVHITDLTQKKCTIFFREGRPLQPLFVRITKRFIAKFQSKKEDNEFLVLDSFAPDLVIISQSGITDGLRWADECQNRNIPYCFIIQLVNELFGYIDPVLLHIHKSFSGATKLFFVSKQNKELLEKMLVSSFGNSSIISNPFRENQTIIAYPSIENGFSIAFVAALNTFHKGHDLLFEAFASSKWKNRNLTIRLYGKGHNDQTLWNMKQKYGLDNIIFEGFESDIDAIWRQNHALLLCSRMEGQSLALIEAMFAGRVPIVTNVGGANEIIVHGETGFIADYPTVRDIDHVLESAWSRKDEWKEMGLKAAARIRSLTPSDPIADFTDQIINLIN